MKTISNEIIKNIIKIRMIVNSRSIGIIWSGLFPKVVIWKKITSSNKLYIKDKTHENHWVENSLMKPMDVYELFNIRIIISKLKARLNHDVVFDASGIT